MVSVEGPVETHSWTRTRSPIPRIKRMFSAKISIPRRPSQNHRCTIPTEVIRNVGHHTSSLRDVLSISLTCQRARKVLVPRLYATVELRTNRHCKVALEAFSASPKVTHHIRILIVRPNNVERTPQGDYLDEELIAGLISTLAIRMPLLRSFYWDGLEMPKDELWLALRRFCPLLKSVGTSVGYLPIRNTDSLFDFRDLKTFILSVKSDSLEWLLDERPTPEKLPRRCWQMLLEHCPNLQELKIGGSAPSPRIFDTRHVTAGRWPRLRKLTLGDMRLQPPDHDRGASPISTLDQFLIVHPRLQEVSFLQPGGDGFPSTLSLPFASLPNMTSFSGPSRYLRCLPHPENIQHLSITTLHHCLSAFPRTYALLKAMPSLLSLTLWIDLTFANRNIIQDDNNIFRNLLECCPSLLHFEVFCFTRPSFHLKDFSAALCRSPRLRSFSLTKVYKPSDEDMSHTAVRIARDNPHIQQFSFRYTQDSWLTHDSGSVKQFGQYGVLAGDDGLPTSILAHEWGFKVFGQPYSRHYVHDLESSKTRRSSGSSRSSWSSSERARSPRPPPDR
ncbi:hypothetical protein E4T56_gene19269 [Termitomyces sp. T112]|nr:hypothetical protein E4T56_gene19269 [Termitomyces sp. T112]